MAGEITGAIKIFQDSYQSKVNDKYAEYNAQLQTKDLALQHESMIHSINKDLAGLEDRKLQLGTELRSTQAEIGSYDRFLNQFGAYHQQQIQSKQAQTDALVASGKESYDNFLNAIGYADAAAGATGRVGAGTSTAHTTKMIDQKLVDYVGEDRKLDANGGLFGSQLTAANMEMGQIRVDLDNQRYEAQQNLNLLNESYKEMRELPGIYDKSIADLTTQKGKLEAWQKQLLNPGQVVSDKDKTNAFLDTLVDPVGITGGNDIAGWILNPLGSGIKYLGGK